MGKMIVVKLYGQILVDFGMFSNGEGMFVIWMKFDVDIDFYIVVVKNLLDFIGEVFGLFEVKMRVLFVFIIGKVLIIDEVYGLFLGFFYSSNLQDSYCVVVIDMIVVEV